MFLSISQLSRSFITIPVLFLSFYCDPIVIVKSTNVSLTPLIQDYNGITNSLVKK